jgi:hypothetical protein
LPLLTAADCQDEVEYERFNASDDALSVVIGAEALDAELVELHSTTGANRVGEAGIEPGGGPAGTIHLVSVHVDADYADRVDRVSIEMDSGDLGTRTFDLVQDSADEGLYLLEIQSVGDDGESRTDTLNVQLWDQVGLADEPTDDSGAAAR